MKNLTHLCFSVFNIVIQDGNTQEYRMGERTLFEVNAHTDTPLEPTTEKAVTLTQIEDDAYEVCGYIYEATCAYALMNINGLKISLCNENETYTENQMYKGAISLAYDPWACYGMNVCDDDIDEDEALYQEGIVEKIQLITSDSLENISLEQTSSWDDEESYEGATSSYLITVAICADKVLYEAPHPLQIDSQRLVLNLKDISSEKVKSIEEFIQKIL
jgi:hypothetical protein